MSSKKPKLAYHQRTTAANNKNREETPASVVEYEYTGIDHHVPINVTHVRIHSSVTTIEVYAFHNRGRLEEVVLNEGLAAIGPNAFMNCNNLQRIKLPSTLTEIGHSAFEKCRRLEEITLNEGLKSIGAFAFQECSDLRSIKLSSTLTVIHDGTFYACSSLREVICSDGLKKIGSQAFWNCFRLESINFPSTLTLVDDYAFNECKRLREVVLKEGLQKIGDRAFDECLSLERIEIPSTVNKIGQRAFRTCTNLREVILNDGIQTMGDNVFDDCPLLDRLIFASVSTRISNIISVGQVEVGNKIDVIMNDVYRGYGRRPLVRRGSELSVSSVLGGGGNWSEIKQCLNRLVGLITYYEVREATTLFELALWKAKINHAEGDSADRGACRVEVPGPVKDTILQYLR